MIERKQLLAGALALAAAMPIGETAIAAPAKTARPDAVSCKLIKTPAQLQAMRNNLAASYCLANDIDLSSIANFQPIGEGTTAFTGKFFGKNHVIRNLRIDDSTHLNVGLFGIATSVIRDVSLVDVNVVGTASNAFVGGLVGQADGSIVHVSVTGNVKCSGGCAFAGGIASELNPDAAVVGSWSAADVTSILDAGGLVGIYGGSISDSFATGNVICTATGCDAGGLLGSGSGIVTRSFATGSVSASGASSVVGGLIGRSSGSTSQSFATGSVTGGASSLVGGLIGETLASTSQSFATGSVTGGASSFVGGLIGQSSQSTGQSFATGSVTGGASSLVGGLIGHASSSANTISQCYAAGRVQGGMGAAIAGLIAAGSPVAANNSYWDKDTTGQPTSAGGAGATGLTTLQLRARLRAGFDPAAWAITKTLSYPFLNDADLDFASPLATLVRSNKVFTFLPIGQFDRAQYRFNPAHEANASLAAVYTMIARAIGITDNVTQLRNVKIDRYFWHDPRQTTTFTGPVTQHATLGVLKPLAANAKLTAANVIGKLNAQRLVILRGTFSNGGKPATHWMLGTLYTRGAGNVVDAVVADDPWTGSQVTIDPVSKTVLSPANFPLRNFKVNGYQPVLVH